MLPPPKKIEGLKLKFKKNPFAPYSGHIVASSIKSEPTPKIGSKVAPKIEPRLLIGKKNQNYFLFKIKKNHEN